MNILIKIGLFIAMAAIHVQSFGMMKANYTIYRDSQKISIDKKNIIAPSEEVKEARKVACEVLRINNKSFGDMLTAYKAMPKSYKNRIEKTHSVPFTERKLPDGIRLFFKQLRVNSKKEEENRKRIEYKPFKLGELPTEAFAEVVSKLNKPDQNTTALVCKNMHQVVHTHQNRPVPFDLVNLPIEIQWRIFNCSHNKKRMMLSCKKFADDGVFDLSKAILIAQDGPLCEGFRATKKVLFRAVRERNHKAVENILRNTDQRTYHNRYGSYDWRVNEKIDLQGIARYNNDEKMLKILDEYHCIPCEDPASPLLIACHFNDSDYVKNIISTDEAVLQNADIMGNAFIESVMKGNIGCIELFLGNPVVRDYLKNKKHGKWLGRILLSNACNSHPGNEILELLLKSECINVNETKHRSFIDRAGYDYTLLDELLPYPKTCPDHITLLKKYGALEIKPRYV